jgi:hypothetical protein
MPDWLMRVVIVALIMLAPQVPIYFVARRGARMAFRAAKASKEEQ